MLHEWLLWLLGQVAAVIAALWLSVGLLCSACFIYSPAKSCTVTSMGLNVHCSLYLLVRVSVRYFSLLCTYSGYF